MTATIKRELWATRVVMDCLLEAGGDVDSALSAADYIIATQPMPVEDDDPPAPVDLNAALAFDIHNRRAQGILNRTIQAARGLNVAARKDLASALKKVARDGGAAVINFVDKYRLQLAKLLTTTQLASLLEGAREVAAKVPTLATFPGAVPPPPTLEPDKAVALVERLEQLTDVARAQAIYALPAAEQVYVQQVLAAKEASPPVVPPKFTPPSPTPGAPEGIHFPTIDEAVKNLAERNVIDRQRYDALDAAARAKAFTVANVEAEETLTKIRDSLAENVKEGVDFETWKAKVLQDVDQGTFLSDAHQETVFRTNVQSALSDGQEMVLSHPLIRSGFPYRARDAIHDDRVRENHLALEKLGIGGTNIYRADDPVWQTFRVPWDYNDRCADTALTVRQAAEAGIKEAQVWLETGVEPTEKAHVKMPDFQPPPSFRRAVASAPMSIRLSMQPMAALANNRPEGGTDTLLYGAWEDDKLIDGKVNKNDPAGPPHGWRKTRTGRHEEKGKTKGKTKGRGKGRRTRPLSKSMRVASRPSVKSALPVALAVGDQGSEGERLTLLSEILVLLFGEHAPQVAEELATGMHHAGLGAAFASGPPQVQRRYGPRPGPGWSPAGTSRLGTPIWTWGSSSGGATPPAPPPGPIPQTSPAPPPPPAPGPVPASTPAPQVPQQLRVGGQRARAASIQAFNDAMTKITAHGALVGTPNAPPPGSEPLSPADKASLAKKLTNMPTQMLRSLHLALGGQRGLVNRQSMVADVKGILTGASPTTPTSPATPPTPTPSTIPPAKNPPVPFQDETNWTVGEEKVGSLNGIDFAPAPPKFWEKVADVDIGEPKPLPGKKVDRAGVMIQEPDGRIWIVQPTNQFGNRKYTLPGGGVEKGLTVQQNALKEVWEETGLQVEITGYAGDFEDSNNGNNGRMYIGRRVGGAPWDAKIEQHIRSSKTGKPAAESEVVSLVTPEKASQLLHRTDDLAQLMAVHPIKLDTNVHGNAMKKFVNGIQPSAEAYKAEKKAKGESSGNAELHVVQEMRGFNKKPTVVKKAAFDALVRKGGHIEMMRGLTGHGKFTAKELADQFRRGDHFPGHGVYGSGTYCDSNKGRGNAATSQYSRHNGAVVRMALPKTAKVVTLHDLANAVPSNPSAFKGYARNGNGKSADECWMGVHAAMAGYDAIYVDGKYHPKHGSYGKGYYIILNRSVMVVQEEDAKGHVIH